MKNLVFLAVIVFYTACQQKKADVVTVAVFGKQIDTTNAMSVADFVTSMSGKSEGSCIIKGKIADVCQKEGCWLNLENENGSKLFVKMKDHAFLLPKDIAGKTIYVQGTAQVDTTSVEMLQHYAEDAGKSQAEIDAITEPEVELSVEAAGVVLLDPADGNKK
jgi:hypothetical protein